MLLAYYDDEKLIYAGRESRSPNSNGFGRRLVEPLWIKKDALDGLSARKQLVELATQHRIAASYDNWLIVDAGGLMSYGPDTVDMYRRAAA